MSTNRSVIVLLLLIAFTTETLCRNSSSFLLDWKTYIDRDILYQYLGRDVDNKLSSRLFEGDIDGVSRTLSQMQLVELSRKLSLEENKLWPGGMVPFVINSAIGSNEAASIRKAMTSVSELSSGCVKFIGRSSQSDYVEFIPGHTCSSFIGRQGKKQAITLSKNCLRSSGDIQHEIMHVLGFMHELSRMDRDDHVWINWGNVQKAHISDLQAYSNASLLNLPYDLESILHFPFNAFALNTSTPTILPRTKNTRIGQNKQLSQLDIVRIKMAYKCNQTASTKTQTLTTLPIQCPAESGPDRYRSQPPFNQRSFELPVFLFQSISFNECLSLDCDGCAISKKSDNCTDGELTVICPNATSNQIGVALQNIERLNRSRPVAIGTSHQCNLPSQLLPRPVNAPVVMFILYHCTNLNMSSLRTLNLANLIVLSIHSAQNKLIISKGDLDGLQSLLKLAFAKCSFASIEEGSFDQLSALKLLILDTIPNKLPMLPKEADVAWLFHCDCRYRWLREMFQRRPWLLRPKADGEIFQFHYYENSAMTLRDIFVPVDCAEDNLKGDIGQTNYSVNDFCDDMNYDQQITMQDSTQPTSHFRPTITSLTLPRTFRMDDVSFEECRSLNTRNCFIRIYGKPKYSDPYCPSYNLYIICLEDAGNEEIISLMQNISRLDRDRPLKVWIFTPCTLTAELFAPVKEHIIFLELEAGCQNFNFSELRYAEIPNLLDLWIKSHQNLTIRKGDLDSFPKLLILIFINCFITSINEGAFDHLTALRQLSFDAHYEHDHDAQLNQIWQLHCDCQFWWIRKLFNQRPCLIKSRLAGEIYSIGRIQNSFQTASAVSFPVDCANNEVEGITRQAEYSVNDHCVWNDFEDEEQPTKKALIGYQWNPKPLKFRSLKVSNRVCALLDTANCKIYLPSLQCTRNSLAVACHENATNHEISSAARRIEKLKSDRPISVVITGSRFITPELFAPIHLNIISLYIRNNSYLRSSAFRNLNLPNLVGLIITNSKMLHLFAADLSVFPKLRELYFAFCSFTAIEEEAFYNLPDLQSLSIEAGTFAPFTPEELEHLKLLHCDCRYSWLRKLFQKRPFLIQEKQRGEMYAIGGLVSPGFPRNYIFVPVDCAKNDLIGSENQTSYSENTQKCEEIQLPAPRSTISGTSTYVQTEFLHALYRNGNISKNECNALDTNHCAIDSTSYYCQGLSIFFKTHCVSATDSEMEAFLRKIGQLLISRSVEFIISLKNQPYFTPDFLDPVKINVTELILWNIRKLKMSAFGNIWLPALVKMHIINVTGIKICRGDLDGAESLRQLLFERCLFATIEEGSFDNLLSLLTLSLAWESNKSSEIPTQADLESQQLWDFVCSCSFSWLRQLYRKRPYLLSLLTSLNDVRNVARSILALFNCLSTVNTVNSTSWSQIDYWLHDGCQEQSGFQNTTLLRNGIPDREKDICPAFQGKTCDIASNFNNCISSSTTITVKDKDEEPTPNPVLMPVLTTFGIGLFLLLLVAGILFFGFIRRKNRAKKMKSNLHHIRLREHLNLADTDSDLADSLSRHYVRMLEVSADELTVTNHILGKGEFGLVIKGHARNLPEAVQETTEVAVKMALDDHTPELQAQFLQELKIMIKIGRHLNIVNLLGVVRTGRLKLILEYCENGSLLKYLRELQCNFECTINSGNQTLPNILPEYQTCTETSNLDVRENNVIQKHENNEVLAVTDLVAFSYQVSRGLEYLTTKTIVHRDIAARNILVTATRIAKIADFGMARKVVVEYVLQNDQVKLPIKWMAPESIQHKYFTYKSDVWSFGVLMWEIFSLGQIPYSKTKGEQFAGNVTQFAAEICQGLRMDRPIFAPVPMYEIMCECWTIIVNDRPTIEVIKNKLSTHMTDNSVNYYLSLDEPYRTYNMFVETNQLTDDSNS